MSASFPVHQEEDALPSGRVARIGLAGILVGAVGVVVAGVWMAMSVGPAALNREQVAPPPSAPRQISEVEQTPILQARDGQDLREAQRRELEGLGWVDRDAGLAHIPIERAMDLVATEPR
jgi:hypothetical protein